MRYRPQIVSVIVWDLIWQLMRRFQSAHDLRVYETHPGGGQYDCLTLRAKDNRASLDFNLEGQSLHVWANGEYIERLDIVDEYLGCDNPKALLDRISDLAGLRFRGKLPPSNGPVLACGLAAAIFRQNMFAQYQLKMLMGGVDTSGYGAGPRLDKFRLFSRFGEPNEVDCYRCFFLEKVSDNSGRDGSENGRDGSESDREADTLCMIDMAGKVILRNGDKIPLELEYTTYGRDLNLMAANIARKAL